MDVTKALEALKEARRRIVDGDTPEDSIKKLLEELHVKTGKGGR